MSSAAQAMPQKIEPSELIRSKLIGIGGLETCQPPERLRTVLGSCVGIILHDPQARILGLAHAILPSGEEVVSERGKFADQAVDNLVSALVALGARKCRLQARLVGGAAMFGKPDAKGLGCRNADSARRRLDYHKVPVIAEALGGTKGRKVIADPENGKVFVEVIGESIVII